MESLDYWRMCDDLSVVQCALLILSKDPKDYADCVEIEPVTRPDGYEAVSTAVKNAVLRRKLNAHVCHEAWDRGWIEDFEPGLDITVDNRGTPYTFRTEPDWHRTTIAVDDLKIWLAGRGVKTGFFFEAKTDSPAYLNPKHKHYAPKLAAAVEAWESVTSEKSTIRARSPKTALTTWLNKNAARFGLVKEDGTPNNLALKEAAKVANWDTKGGAPKTPTKPDH